MCKNVAEENRKRRAIEYLEQQALLEKIGLHIMLLGCCAFGAFCALVGAS